MKTHISIPVPTELFLDLADFLRENRDPRDPVDVVDLAIRYWLENASMKPEDLLQDTDARGYQWKSLFLPEGTQVRMQYKGAYRYARVTGDELVFDGEPASPGAMANAVAGTSRNAWRDLWIKRPNDKEWKLADDCRAEHRAEVERLEREIDKL